MKYIYLIQKQKWKFYNKIQSQIKIRFNNSDYLVYLGRDKENNEIFVFYYKKSHNYLIKIFKNIILEILNEKDIIFLYAIEKGTG